jgi:hypothetical protein
MKNFKFILSAIITFLTINVHSQNFQWDRLKGESTNTFLFSNICDGNNNLYAVGAVSASNTVIGTTTYNPSGGQDGIIIKYDALGNVIWSKSIGGSGGEGCSGVSLDLNGNVYITGESTSSIVSVGSNTFMNQGGFTFPNFGVFIIKLDSNGNLLFAKTVWQGGFIPFNQLKLNIGLNSIILSAYLLSNSQIAINNNTLTSQNGDFLITSFDLNANLNWSKFYSGSGDDFISGIIVQKNDDIYFTGTTNSQSLTVGSNTLSSPNSTTNLGFVAKLNAAGNISWLKKYSNSNVPNIRVASINTNTIYLAFPFTSSLLSIGSNSYSSQNNDCIILQMDSLGNYQWSKLIVGNQGAEVWGLAVNQNNYIYLSGRTTSSVISTTNHSIANTSSLSNLFFAGFDAQGKDWGLLISSRPTAINNSGLSPYSISMDANNNGYIAGVTNSDLVCGTQTISTNNLNTAFIAKIKLLNGVGFDELKINNEELKIYPNPTSTQLNFISESNMYSDLSIINAFGQTIYTKQNADLNQSLDVSFLNAGVYFVKIQNQLSQKTIKVIKE